MSTIEAAGSSPLLTAQETDGVRRHAEPITLGVPFARGRVPDSDFVGLARDGLALPCQVEVLDRWSDGSVRWALLDFPVDLEPRGSVELEVTTNRRPAAPPDDPIRANEMSSGWFVDTGRAQFTIDREAFLPFRSVRVGGLEVLDPARSGWSARGEGAPEWHPRVRSLVRETAGELRTTLLVEGALGAGRDVPLDFIARLHFYAGSGSVKLQLTVRNPRRSRHPGGHWELGDAGSVLLHDLSVRLALTGESDCVWSPEVSAPLAAAPPGPFELYQDSSGGENWQSRVHLTRDRAIPTTFRGYRVRTGEGEERMGRRATPRVAVHRKGSGVAASMRHFWQNFPKAMEVAKGTLTVRLFPGQYAAPHELQGGEQKTHEVWLSFGPDATDPAADAFRCPLLVAPTPASFVASEAVPYLTTADSDGNELYKQLLEQALEGDDTFEHKREKADEYGWRHFGELWADHESRFSEIEGTFVSHYNNQYDVVYGAFLQYARTGDIRWFRLVEELARHVIDIDIYHTMEDKPAYNQGLFWPTVHYVDADLSTHRTYPKRGSVGGGPDDEHNYTTGLMHFHFLTGDLLGRGTAIASAQWVIDADDGSRTILKWLDRSRTGLATKTRYFDYHGPGRGAGNSINALLDGWRLTGDERFLRKCHEVIHRSIHPNDDLAARNLLDAENRWSYTVHLQALGKFLDTMAEGGRVDEHYTYARASLIAYARWMLEHERPILETPDELEYPNETWPAQDLRKSDVFKFAAQHTTGEERDRFLERGDWFFHQSLESLASFDTKSYSRPVVTLMHYGLMQSWFDQRGPAERPAPAAEPSFGSPQTFVPQKTRAMSRLKRAAIAGAVLGAGGVAALVKALL